MRRILNTGIICISTSPSEKYLILRPRGLRDGRGIVSFLNASTPCILLSDEECMLTPQFRPSEGLLYIVHNGEHKAIYSTLNMKKDYEPYQDILNVYH